MAYPQDQHNADGREAGGILWFTVAQAAAFIGGSRQTIYGWERRGLLKDPHTDEHGRRIYSQQQIAEAHRQAKQNAEAVRGAA